MDWRKSDVLARVNTSSVWCTEPAPGRPGMSRQFAALSVTGGWQPAVVETAVVDGWQVVCWQTLSESPERNRGAAIKVCEDWAETLWSRRVTAPVEPSGDAFDDDLFGGVLDSQEG